MQRISLFLAFVALIFAPELQARDYPPREGIWSTGSCPGEEFKGADAALSGAEACVAEDINSAEHYQGFSATGREYRSCSWTWKDPVTQQTYCISERWRITFEGQYDPGSGTWYPSTQTRDVTVAWQRECEGDECDPKCTEDVGLPRHIYPLFDMDQGMDVAYCYQQCVYTSSGGGGVCIGLGDGPVYCKGKARLMEGAQCTEQDYEPATPENCAIMGGQMICMDAPQRDCSVIDGEAICGPAPPNGCKLLGNGGMLCDDDAPNQPTNPDGTPADPDGQVISSGGNVQNYYSSETVNNSGTPTYGEWTGGDGDGDGEGLEGVAQEDTLQDVLDALTPGDGDTVGTDTGVIAEWLGETAIGDVEAAVQREENIPGLSSSFLPVLPSGGACQKVSGTALGMSFEFPSNSGCVYLGYFREILAWALYILTIVYIWSIVMRRKED